MKISRLLRLTFTIALCLCLGSDLNSQQAYRVTYRSVYDGSTMKDILVFNDSLSFLFRVRNLEKDPFELGGIYGAQLMHHGFMYNRKSGMEYNQAKSGNKGIGYVIKDSFRFKNWDLSERETKKIKGYNCKKAKYYESGDLWIIAWYTSDLPFEFGPPNCFGLPGLVIKAEYKKWHWTSTVSQIERGEFKIVMPVEGTIVSPQEFKDLMKQENN